MDLSAALWIDVEASGFGPESYPIEVGWCDIAGNAESVLIRPAPGWTFWSQEAEGVHGISRAQLEAEGVEPAEAVARIVAATMTADEPRAGRLAPRRVVFSDAPEFDGVWLARLFRVAGSDLPFGLEGSMELVTALATRLGVDSVAADIQAQREAPVTHRAADDARFWATFTRLVVERAQPKV